MSDILAAAEYLSRHRELAVLEVLAPFAHPIVIAGAYTGATVQALRLLDPHVEIHGFEPQPWCHIYLEGLPLTLHPVALGDHDGEVSLHRIGGDQASLVDTSKDGEEPSLPVQMVEAGAYLAGLSREWSLFLFNMEGYEFTFLPYLDSRGVLANVDNLLVQFHPKVSSQPVPSPRGFGLRWERYPAWVWWQRKAVRL